MNFINRTRAISGVTENVKISTALWERAGYYANFIKQSDIATLSGSLNAFAVADQKLEFFSETAAKLNSLVRYKT